MDELDKRILRLLCENARMPVKDIAREVALTSPAVSSRIRRLERDGVIAGYTAVLRVPQANNTVSALISVANPPAQRQEFLQTVAAQPSVQQCYHVTGSYSFIVKVLCPDMDALEHLITTFQKMGQTNTQLILSAPVNRDFPGASLRP